MKHFYFLKYIAHLYSNYGKGNELSLLNLIGKNCIADMIFSAAFSDVSAINVRPLSERIYFHIFEYIIDF